VFQILISESESSLQRVKLRDVWRSHARSFDCRRSRKQIALWRAFHEIHGEDLISNSVHQIQSRSQVVIFGKFYDWQSYDLESFPRTTFANTNAFLSLVESFPIGPERKNKKKNWVIGFTLYDQSFLSEAGTIKLPSKFNGYPSHWQGK